MRSKLSILILALLVSVGGIMSLHGTHAQVPAKDIDLTAGLPVQESSYGLLKPMTVTSNGDKEVLWDLTHGVYFNYEPSGRYTNLVSILQGQGYNVTTTTNISGETLSQYDVVVINLCSAWDSPYTSSEVSQIRSYVQNGGGLFIMGNNRGCPNDNINPVSQAFGVTCGVSTLSPTDLYFTDLTSHSIFASVFTIYYRLGGELTASSPGEEVAWTGGGQATIAVVEEGAGRVVVTGDGNFCENTYIGNSDNQQFCENIFDWLSTAGSWSGGKFDFNDGTGQGWTLQGAYDEAGGGPFPSAFSFHWRDRVNHPNPPGLDSADDNKGSIAICTIGGHGISNPGATWWIMQFHSPDLSSSSTWQGATGYTVEIAECMSTFPSMIIYSNLYVVVYDIDEGRDRYFYNGTAQALEHDVYGDGNADWNHLTFDWSGASGFPTNYIVKEVFVNIWGKMSDYVEGGLYLDEVVPIGGPILQPDISVIPALFNVTLAQGATTTSTLTIGNVGSANLTFNISTVPAVGWLSLSQSSGTVTPGTDTDITVTFDAAGLSPGTHQTDIVISSNDPDESTVTIPVTLDVTGGGWTGGKFDFNDGTDQGWSLDGAYDESGNGPFLSYFSFDWWDQVNHPNTPFTDPWGDNKGSIMLFTPSGHGVNNPGATWWIMQFHSPDLSASSTWQGATGYTVEIADAMSTGGTLYSNLYVVVYDIDQSRDRYFYSGTAQPLQHYSVADWNHLTFDWSGASGFPTNYIVKEVFVNIWGRMTDGVDGAVFLDEVIPISGPTLQPDITVVPGSFDVTLAQGTTITQPLTIGNVGDADLTFNITTGTGSSTGDMDVMITGWGDLNPGTSLDNFVAHIRSLGYNVTTSNTFPSDLSGYEILILVGGGSAHEDIPESVVDNFVNSGNGLIIFEGVVWADGFSPSAASNPVQSTSGWSLRTNAHVVDAGNSLSSGVATNCTFQGYSTEPTMKSGAQIALRWDDDAVFAATYQYGSGKVAYINDLWSWYGNYWKGDVTNGEQLLENALQNVLPGAGSATWLSVAPSFGTITPGTDTDVIVTFDATGLFPGTYQTNIIISSNDPDEPTVTIPATLEVTSGALPTVKIEPATKEIYLGSTGSVNILIENITDLGSFEFEIAYDGTIIQIAGAGDVVQGSFLGSTGRSVIPVGPDIDNTAGSVVYGAASFGTQTGASGSGVLATITWTPQIEGTTTLDLKNVKVSNTDGTEIPVNEIDGEITVVARFWADIDGDNDVDIIDIQLVAARWNTHVGDPGYDPSCDVDDDGDIDIIDIQLVAGWWNKPISSSSSGSRTQLVNPDHGETGVHKPSSEQAENLILRITPDESNGSLMSLAVTVENAVDLGAFQFELVSNTDQIKIADIQLGEFLGSSGNTVSVVGPARDKSGNKIVFGAFSYGENSGPYGSGLLARIELNSEVKNSIPIELKNLQIVDKEGKPVRVNAIVNECSEWKSRQALPKGFALRQNYPNPFNPTTSISFELPGDQEDRIKVNLRVYNTRGQVVRTLVDEEKSPGTYTIHWDGKNELGKKVSSGLYLYTIVAGDFRATRKMVILK